MLQVRLNLTAKLRGANPQQTKQNFGVRDMSENTDAGRVSIPLQRELGAGLELKEPKNTKHYKPLEEPRAYPLELNENLHICLWDEKGEYKWTIAYWQKDKEGYFLVFVGNRPLEKRVKWKKLKSIIRQGQAIADKRFSEET